MTTLIDKVLDNHCLRLTLPVVVQDYDLVI